MTRSHALLVVLAACGGSHAANSDAPAAAIDAVGTVTIDGAIDAPLDAPLPIDAALDGAPDGPPPPLGAGWTLLSGVSDGVR